MNKGQFNLSVTSPCKEDWSSMIPASDGRHCISCNKNVIDFSKSTDEEIQLFFMENQGHSVCGRFSTTQLEQTKIYLPKNIFFSRIPLWQKYLLIFMICFGSNNFSIDVIFKNNSGLYAQTIASKTNDVKKISKKNKIKRHKYELTQEFDSKSIETIILGFVQFVPVKQMPPLSILLSKPALPSAKRDSTANNDPKQEKRRPKKKDHREKMEFLLPQSEKKRRRK